MSDTPSQTDRYWLLENQKPTGPFFASEIRERIDDKESAGADAGCKWHFLFLGSAIDLNYGSFDTIVGGGLR